MTLAAPWRDLTVSRIELEDCLGRRIRLEGFRGSAALVVMVLRNQCPYVDHLRPVLPRVVWSLRSRGVAVVGLNPLADPADPQESPRRMVQVAREAGYVFPYLCDVGGRVAESLEVTQTPEFLVFDGGFVLRYQGRFDDSSPERPEVPVTGRDVRRVCEAILAGDLPPQAVLPGPGTPIPRGDRR